VGASLDRPSAQGFQQWDPAIHLILRISAVSGLWRMRAPRTTLGVESCDQAAGIEGPEYVVWAMGIRGDALETQF